MQERIRKDLEAALKARDRTTVSVLRMLLSELRNEEIAAGGDLDDERVVRVLKKAAKQRAEAAEQFEAGGRPERAEQERAEIEVVRRYLPEMLEGEELDAVIDEVITETGASSPSDMGRVMGELMQRHGPRIDGKAASARVRERLSA